MPPEPATRTSLEHVGCATTLLRLGPFTLLTDPNFMHRGQRAYLGNGLFSKRLTEPSLQPEDLPPVDGVVLSHLHGDHFDRTARDRLPRDLPVHTTPKAARTLRRWGFTRAAGLRTWEHTDLERDGARLRLTSAPGVHAPGPVRRLLPPVMGTVLELDGGSAGTGGRPFRVYVSGDTLHRPWLAEVVERCGPLDAAVLHLGGTRALGVLVTMDGAQGADLLELLRPGVAVPVHHDDYTVFRSPLSDFLDACGERGLATEVRPVDRGGVVDLRP